MPPSSSDPKARPNETDELRAENARLNEELSDLRILYQNTIEHGEAVEDQLADANTELAVEKKKADDLLLNILPAHTASELKQSGKSPARAYDPVTVMFTDFHGFTQISEKLTPKQLVAELDLCFRAFDEIIGRYQIEKIKTIGDSYLCAAGLPLPTESHATDIVCAALEFQRHINDLKAKKQQRGEVFFEMRVGIHTGPLIAGIVGVRKFAYDIWGDTVNTASRMESSCEVGKVNMSGATWALVKHRFDCTPRGKIAAKNKGQIEMYFVNGEKTPTAPATVATPAKTAAKKPKSTKAT